MATKLKDLQLDDAHATAILEKAKEYEAFTDDMPGTKKARIAAATDQIALMVDAWVGDDQVNPDNEDPDIAEMGKAIEEIFEIAGVEIDDEGEVNYVDPADLEEEEDEDEEDEDEDAEEDEDEDDDESAVDINDVIKGYDDLSAAGKVKAIKKLELDMEEDEDYNTATALYEYEQAQEKPSSRVLAYLDEVMPEAEDEEPEDEDAEEEENGEEEDEDAEEDESEEEEESGEWEQPWTKADGAPADYDKQSAVDVKKYLDKLLAKEELSAEMLQYVMDYEEQRDKPTRKRIIDYATKLMDEVGESEGEEEPEEEAEEEAPKRSGRPTAAKGRGTRRSRSKQAADPDDSEDADDAVDRDDEREARKSKAKQAVSFIISGGDEDITATGPNQAAGIVADLLMAGIDSITVEAG